MKTGKSVHVDKDVDWAESIAAASNSTYRRRDLNISKRMYDEIKYMNGYYAWYRDFWADNLSVTAYDGVCHNCAGYTRDLWYDITGEWHEFGPVHDNSVRTPASLYNSIWWFNHQVGPSSQCETNTWSS